MDEKEEFRQFYIDYQIKKQNYPEELRDTLDKMFNITNFYYNVAEALIEECSGKLTDLAYIHYPEFVSITSPIIKDYFKDINQVVLLGIAYSMKQLVENMKAGVDIKEKYPELESWRSFYVHPSPHIMDDSLRNTRLHPNDDEWKQYVAEQNRELKRCFLWEEKRKKEFYDVVQPVLMRLYPKLDNLEGDYWVLYAVNLRDEYEVWESAMDEVQTGIVYEMPPEFVKWDDEEFRDEVSKRFSEYGEISMKKRTDQINSFKLEDEL
jgi:hypothetical protein